MRSLLLACLLLTGCDSVFQLDRPPPDAMLFDAPPVCPAAFGTSRYLYFATVRSWTAAEAACVLLDTVVDDTFTHLAVITDSTEIAVAALELPADEEVWVGLTDRKVDNTFVWITDELALDHPIPWGSSEPDSSSTVQCGAIETRNSTLGDSGCDSTPHPYVCECDGYAEQQDRIF